MEVGAGLPLLLGAVRLSVGLWITIDSTGIDRG
nr:MAG TPA: hypothetical protein [Caudoviricetes sp.]